MRLFKLIVLSVFVGLLSQLHAQEKPEMATYDVSKQVKLYPNPAVEYLTVKFETAQAKTATFTLHTIIGTEVEAEK